MFISRRSSLAISSQIPLDCRFFPKRGRTWQELSRCYCKKKPTPLKRGSNNDCASGAGKRTAVGIENSRTVPFEGPPTIKPLALPEDIYS